MKKLSLRKMLVLLLAALMVVSSLAGCAGSDEGSKAEESKAEESKAESKAEESKADETGEKVQLTIWAALNGKTAQTVSSYEDVYAMQLVEEKLGIDINWQHPPVGQEAEQFNLLVASMELPDMIEWDWSTYAGGPEKALSDEVILKLNDYMDKAPYLSAVYEAHPEAKTQASTDEGSLICFPRLRGYVLDPETAVHNHYTGLTYRQDWLNAAGMEEPTTIEELHDMLAAFKENGEDVLPMVSTGLTGVGYLCPAFGFLRNWYMEDGKVSFGLLADGYKDWVETMKAWYDEGLLDPDFMATDGDSQKAKVTDGRAGFYIGSMGGNWVTYSKIMEETVPEGKLWYMKWLEADDGIRHGGQEGVLDVGGYNGLGITTQNTNLDACIKYADYGFSDEGSMLIQYGVEGEQYQWSDEGVLEFTPDMKKATDEKGTDYVLSQYAFGCTAGWPSLGTYEGCVLTRTYPGQAEMVYTWGDCEDDLYVRPITATVDEAGDLADIMNQVTTYYDEMTSKMIMGQASIDEIDSVIEACKSMGLEDAIAIKNAALERYNNR